MTQKEIYEHQIALMEAIDRLYDNEDFQLLIVDGYLRDECARAIKASTSCSLSKEQREDCTAMAQAAGYLQQYLITIHNQGEIAKSNLDEYLQDRLE